MSEHLIIDCDSGQETRAALTEDEIVAQQIAVQATQQQMNVDLAVIKAAMAREPAFAALARLMGLPV